MWLGHCSDRLVAYDVWKDCELVHLRHVCIWGLPRPIDRYNGGSYLNLERCVLLKTIV